MSNTWSAVNSEVEREETATHTVDSVSTPYYSPGEALSDTLLISQICQRQEPALGSLYDRYGSFLYAIALRITSDRLVAEEVIQDVFHAVWQSAHSFRADGNVRAWLIGIVRHRAIDATRVRQFRAHNDTVALDDLQLASLTGEPERVVIGLSEHEEMQRVLAHLPTPQRNVIDLTYYVGLTCAEIAKRTNVPIGTVKTRLRLGLIKLRALLSQDPSFSMSLVKKDF